MSKTMTRDQVKSYILSNNKKRSTETAVNFARQLYDVMGENEKKLPNKCLRTHFDPNRHCDAERVIAWIDDPNRPKAYTAFTEGLERQIAYRFEDVLIRANPPQLKSGEK